MGHPEEGMCIYYAIRKEITFAVSLFQAGAFACTLDESCLWTFNPLVDVIL